MGVTFTLKHTTFVQHGRFIDGDEEGPVGQTVRPGADCVMQRVVVEILYGRVWMGRLRFHEL